MIIRTVGADGVSLDCCRIVAEEEEITSIDLNKTVSIELTPVDCWSVSSRAVNQVGDEESCLSEGEPVSRCIHLTSAPGPSSVYAQYLNS